MNRDTKAGEALGRMRAGNAVSEKIQNCRKNGSGELDLSGCALTELPPELAGLKQLTVLDLSRNRLKSLPEFLCGLTGLEYLDLSGNRLETLPENIGSLSKLGTLKLSSNRLKTLPKSIEQIPLLEILEIDGNEIPNPGDYTDPAKTDDILDHMDKIITYSQRNGLTRLFYKTARAHIDFVSGRLNITPVQAVLFSHLCNNANKRIFFSVIAEQMHCNVIKNIQFRNDFDELEKRKFIRCRRGGQDNDDSLSFRIPMHVQESLRKNGTVVFEKNVNLEFFQFFHVVWGFVCEKSRGELSYEIFEEEIMTLVDDNPHLDFCKKIKNCPLEDIEKIMLIYFFCKLIVAGREEITFEMIEEILSSFTGPRKCDRFLPARRALEDGTHPLIEKLYIENAVHENMFGSRESFRLTSLAKEEFIPEIDLQAGIKRDQKDLIHAENIGAKTLFYNEKEAHKIKRLTELLQEDCFLPVQERLSQRGLRRGFACFFYGPPGTGKTETAYQIARLTGRSIQLVDLSEIKSCWYGESEKIIKSVFSRYKKLAERSKLIPILLFNEADGIFGKRTETGGHNPTLEKTENTIQNIILEEMEKLSGILIATTNLTGGFDPAFERRFLYKIEFEKPRAAVRTSIWRSIIPELSEEESRILAERFDFSGGQIENIARKRAVESIISGADPDLDTLISFCQDELINKGTGKRIGFGTEE